MATLTNIQQAAYQRRSLSTLKDKVVAMSIAWGDVDGYFENRLEELAKEIEKIEKEMVEFIADEKNRPVGDFE
jgi:ATP-dependent Clp protease ATP-binding subunit ClpA